MREVFFIFKLAEFILSVCCLSIHIYGSSLEEKLVQDFIFAGSFFSFTLISFFGCFAIQLGVEIPVLVEVFLSFFGFILFLFCSLLSMYYVENDMHLMYLTDKEEWSHKFFYVSRIQSVFSLTNSFLFLLHGLFAVDIVVITEDKDGEIVVPADGCENLTLDQMDAEASKPLKLYLICDPQNKFKSEFLDKHNCCGALSARIHQKF